MKTLNEKSVGQIVADNYRAASVFKSFNIDFCCKGNRTLHEVCEKNGIREDTLQKALEEATQDSTAGQIDYKSWPVDLLADYIEKTHHRYVEEKIPEIKAYLDKVCSVHGKSHPELFEIRSLFNDSAGELTKHMKKEELILFPFIRKMVEAKLGKKTISTPHFGTVGNPVNTMMQEHDAEGERFRKIAQLSKNYTPPQDACNTYGVTFALLKEFEEDLHLHIHLENNILFPKAINLEQRLSVSN